MRDNTLAAALGRLGADVHLVPLYTPIRTDEESVADDRVFFGGINVYLEQHYAWLRQIPGVAWLADRLLDQPWLIRSVASGSIEVDAKQLGEMTLSMLRGEEGRQRDEVHKLCDWLVAEAKPELLDLSNLLIAGCIPTLKRRLDVPVFVTLQGDDIFLDGLVEPYRAQVLAEMRNIVPLVDVFLVHSHYYGDHMTRYLGLPPERVRVVPLGIDTRDFATLDAHGNPGPDHPPTIGYLARLAPEKGLHVLVEAFLRLRKMPGLEDARLHLAGWLGAKDKKYADEQFARLKREVGEEAFRYFGVVDRKQKLEFLGGLDVLSVPTTYREPKGLYVLEALAAGVPVVQPAHGAFPELLAAIGGGRLIAPENPAELAEALVELLRNRDERVTLSRQGRAAVHSIRTADAMAQATLEEYRRVVGHASNVPVRT